jgi:hypothetical protein
LLVHFDVIIEMCRERAGGADTCGDLAHVTKAGRFREGDVTGSYAPQYIRFKACVRDEVRETAVDAIDIVALDVVIGLTIDCINHGGSEYANFDPRMVEIEPCGVECAPHVAPVGWADHSFVAKAEHLAAHHDIKQAFARAAKLQVSFPDIPYVLVR